MEIWIRRQGKEYGPYTLEQVKAFMDASEVTLEDKAWFDGCKEYQTVREIPGMSDPEGRMPVPEKTKIQEGSDRERGVQFRLIVILCVLTLYTLVTIGYFTFKLLGGKSENTKTLNDLEKVDDPKNLNVASIQMEMVFCDPGKFLMGSPDDQTLHKVELTQGFYLGKHEITQAQWEIVMKSNPSSFQGARRPVENVSWNDAMSFCQKLTEIEEAAGRLEKGWTYQLPSEAQWEYACRASTKTIWSFGGDASELSHHGNYADRKSTVSWADRQNDGYQNTAPAGFYRPNPWGFHDMHGNVWEWCRDLYGSYSTEPVEDPEGSAKGTMRTVRGGSWYNKPSFTSSSIRDGNIPTKRLNALGFRCSFQPVK